jgi:uncharacterized protein (DUF1501 family)
MPNASSRNSRLSIVQGSRRVRALSHLVIPNTLHLNTSTLYHFFTTTMDRRDFIRGAAAVALPLTLNGYTVRAMGLSPMLEKLAEEAAANDRILVLIQLQGGNDGINTVIPLDQMSDYNRVRANVAIPENRVLKLTNATGLHPSMTGLKTLYDEGKVAILQGVTYPSPNQSHFRSTDIWVSGSAFNQYLAEGWVARYLETQFKNYPAGYPNASMPDPLAIQISASPSPLFRSEQAGPMGYNLDAGTFNALVNATSSTKPTTLKDTPANRQIEFIRGVQVQSSQYASSIKAAAAKANNRATYPNPNQNSLADQLKIVARMIGGGLQTRVYLVTMGGFDTHANQVLASDRTQGTHANLLNRVSEAIRVFQEDIKLMGVENKVVGMTFSEFGRRVTSNVASGTDHGTAAPVFVFGAGVKGGIIGSNPSLTDLTNNNLKMQYDFRDIYASVLRQWFQVSQTEYSGVFSRQDTQLPIFRTAATTDVVANAFAVPLEMGLRNYPNPCSAFTMVEYTIPNASNVKLGVYDTHGREVAAAVEQFQPAGTYAVNVNVGNFPEGAYIYRLQTENGSVAGRMMVAR